jgi:hypothetical protein
MSATAKALEQQPAATGGRHRPTLRLVRAPRRSAARLPFVAVVVVLLSIGLIGLLLLSMQRGQASFQQGTLATTNASLADQVQALQRTVENDKNPGVLAARALALGMVPETDPGYLDARGQVIGPVPSGDPRPATGATAVDGVVVAGVPVVAPVVAAPAPKPVTAVKVSTAPSTAPSREPTTTAATKPATKPSAGASAPAVAGTPATTKTGPTPTTSRSAR